MNVIFLDLTVSPVTKRLVSVIVDTISKVYSVTSVKRDCIITLIVKVMYNVLSLI